MDEVTEIEIGERMRYRELYGTGYWIKCGDGYGEVIRDKKKWGEYGGQEGERKNKTVGWNL